MTIVLPKDYHAKAALERRSIRCIDLDQALREDIRALRIGILNIMPQAETYEYSLLEPLGHSVLQIEPVWIKLKTHRYTSTDRSHLDKLYVPFEEAVDRSCLDGLVLTGAPVEEIPFEEISYWEEIRRVLRYARNNITSTLGICWGGLALAQYLGIPKIMYPEKVFGIFETRNLDRDNIFTGHMDDMFWCPQSRHSGIADSDAEKARDQGTVNLLAYAEKGGYTIIESGDHRFLLHLGHPEYEAGRLVEEYERDMKLGRTDVAEPEKVDLKRPVNRWRGHRTEFFSQWIKYIHETTTY
jgi:homoserine O-succinyltransferase